MITQQTGNIFDSKCQTLVNPVNCFGVMGAGLALQFKQKYPKMFNEYRELCKLGRIKVNHPVICTLYPTWIVNFPTKNHWTKPSQLTWIEQGLIELAYKIKTEEWAISSIAIPPLGCGLGGLNKDDVYRAIESAFAEVDIQIEIFW